MAAQALLASGYAVHKRSGTAVEDRVVCLRLMTSQPTKMFPKAAGRSASGISGEQFVSHLLQRAAAGSHHELSLVLELSQRCIQLIAKAVLDALGQVGGLCLRLRSRL